MILGREFALYEKMLPEIKLKTPRKKCREQMPRKCRESGFHQKENRKDQKMREYVRKPKGIEAK